MKVDPCTSVSEMSFVFQSFLNATLEIRGMDNQLFFCSFIIQ